MRTLAALVIFISLSSATSLASSAIQKLAPSCESQVVPQQIRIPTHYKELNYNAQTPASLYDENNRRTYTDYERLLLAPFPTADLVYEITLSKKNQKKSVKWKHILQPNQTFIDVGAGTGLAGLELATHFQLNGHLINAQDMSTYFSALKKQGLAVDRVQYHVGYAEEVLLQLRDQADWLFDVWGAYSYSPARKTLIEMYYMALKPGGTALIYFHPTAGNTMVNLRSEIRASLTADEVLRALEQPIDLKHYQINNSINLDIITARHISRIPFERFLAEKYPDIFSLHYHPISSENHLRPFVLKIKKPIDPKKAKKILPLPLREISAKSYIPFIYKAYPEAGQLVLEKLLVPVEDIPEDQRSRSANAAVPFVEYQY